MILPFAQHIITNRNLQTKRDAVFLGEFGIEVTAALMERPLEEWYNSDEAFLVPRTGRNEIDASGTYGAITLPRVRLSPIASETSLDISVGNAFVGFHLLVSRTALEALPNRGKLSAGFPADPVEIQSVVAWGEFGDWLSSNSVRARILGDRATLDFFSATLPFSGGAESLVDLVKVESNSGRLDQLKNSPPGTITIAVATGPLLALARSQRLVILTKAWDILHHCRQNHLTFRTASDLLFKQYVFLGISRKTFESEEDAEDAVYRCMLFVEAAYRLIQTEGRLFAQYCAVQWKELRDQFDGRSEFEAEINITDIEFAIDASYRWLGHTLATLKPYDDWPDDEAEMRDCAFWTSYEQDQADWPRLLERRNQARLRVEALTSRAVALLGPHDSNLQHLIMERSRTLISTGCLRQAERALEAVIINLENRTL